MITAPILIVIVNYRTPDLTVAALRAIAPEIVARGDAQVIVVDNASDDGSPDRIAEGIVALDAVGWCTLYLSPHNGGFAAGNNAAIRLATREGHTPDMIWLLNPDTIAQADALGALVRFMEAHPHAGIVGGRVLAPDGTANTTAFHFHSPIGEFLAALGFGPLTRRLIRHDVAIPIPDAPIRADWVEGSHMLIRHGVIDAIGLMDEGYFLYFEETDFCARAAHAGFECWHVPDSRVVHISGQSTGVTGAAATRARRPRYWFASRARYFRRYHGWMGTNLANLLWLIAYPPGRVLARLRGRPRQDPPRLWRDFLVHNYGLRGLMYHRYDDGLM